MAITVVDKIKITKYLKEHAIGDIWYQDMCEALGKKINISDLEFLEYFTDCVIKEFSKDEKISVKHVCKLVVTVNSFLQWVNEVGTVVNSKLLDKIRSFPEYYEDYLKRNNVEIDIDLSDEYIKHLMDDVNSYYPLKDSSESVVEYLKDIDDLENQIISLKRELENLNGNYEYLQKNYDAKIELLGKKSEEVFRLNQTITTNNRDIANLNATIDTLNRKIQKLEKELNDANLLNEELLPLKEKCDLLSKQLQEFMTLYNSREKEAERLHNLRLSEEAIEKLIYKKLLVDGSNLNDLLLYLSESGYNMSRKDTYELLKRIKGHINIDEGTFKMNPFYKVVAPNILEDGNFDINIPIGCKQYDILLVSDFHVKEVDTKFLNAMDMINNYCAKQNISLVLNLGDYYDHIYIGNDYDNAVANYRCAEKVISSLPYTGGIYHAILGGNHDKKILRYGFDPIAKMALEREDIIHLGYTHATISLNGSSSLITKFDLHHPQGIPFQIHLNQEGIDTDILNDYLNNIYEKQGRSRDDSYIDIFGHTHRNQFNYIDSYSFIPSYLEGKNKRGACHLRIYFDEDTQIKYMVFMPLVINDTLVKTTEIVYQKVLSK